MVIRSSNGDIGGGSIVVIEVVMGASVVAV